MIYLKKKGDKGAMEYLFSLLICMPNTNKVTINSKKRDAQWGQMVVLMAFCMYWQKK